MPGALKSQRLSVASLSHSTSSWPSPDKAPVTVQ
jgi:hypothetical protein